MEAMNQSGLILIERQMEHCLGQQQTITSDIARLKAEISQLERVRDSIRFYGNFIVDNKKRIYQFPGHFSEWHGINANTVFQSCCGGGLTEGYTEMISNITKTIDAINEKVKELQALLANQENALGGLLANYSFLASERDSLRNREGL